MQVMVCIKTIQTLNFKGDNICHIVTPSVILNYTEGLRFYSIDTSVYPS